MFFLEIMHLDGSVSSEFKSVMNPFYHKLSKYLVFLNYVRYSLRVRPDDAQGQRFKKQIEQVSRKGIEAVVSGRDISYLSDSELDLLCNNINHIWYVLDRGGQLRKNLAMDDSFSKVNATEAIKEVFPQYEGRSLDVQLLYESSGEFYNAIWEPVQHCTANYEYFLEEAWKARKIVLSTLAFAMISIVVTMVWVGRLPAIVPCILAIVSAVLFSFALIKLSFVNKLSKRIIRSTSDEMKETRNLFTMSWSVIAKWFEPIGLAILLLSFGWQCLEEHTNQIRMEGYVYELNEKLVSIWEGVYDEAVHSDRYNGKSVVSVNYDVLNSQMEDWNQVKDSFATIDRQANVFWGVRVALYVIGTLLIVVAKWPHAEGKEE